MSYYRELVAPLQEHAFNLAKDVYNTYPYLNPNDSYGTDLIGLARVNGFSVKDMHEWLHPRKLITVIACISSRPTFGLCKEADIFYLARAMGLYFYWTEYLQLILPDAFFYARPIKEPATFDIQAEAYAAAFAWKLLFPRENIRDFAPTWSTLSR